MSTELVTLPKLEVENPAANYRMATDVAGLCKEIVVKSAVNIAGKKYVRAEGWQAIATAHGCVASARDVEHVEGGIRCVGEVRKVSDGTVIATAEGFVGEDEPTWEKRPEYAKRAMCQTRSISRACRSAFAHIIVLMDARLSTTPAEEVPDDGFEDAKPARPLKMERPQQQQPASNGETPGGWQDHVIHFGKNKGVRLGDLKSSQLRWYQNVDGQGWTPQPFRGRISDQDEALRAALDESLGKSPKLAPQADDLLEEVPPF